jgi:hypothetical protein
VGLRVALPAFAMGGGFEREEDDPNSLPAKVKQVLNGEGKPGAVVAGNGVDLETIDKSRDKHRGHSPHQRADLLAVALA